MKRKYIIGFCILIIVLLLVIFLIIRHSRQTTIAQLAAVHKLRPPKEVLIILTKNGFIPNRVTITVGTAVRWKNESGSVETVNSDNYPTNKLNRELNFGTFNSNSSVVYIFTKPGVYGYHNQFHHEQEGKVVVIRVLSRV